MPQSPWNGVLRALETEPVESLSLKGSTGYAHEFVGLGVDHRRRRLIAISRESDPRFVAMAQADIQALDTSIHVIAMRAMPLDVTSDNPFVNMERLEPFFSFEDDDESMLLAASAAFVAFVKRLQPRHTLASPPEDGSAVELTEDPFAEDRRFGLCPVPIFQFSENELDAVRTDRDIEAIRAALARIGVLQYVFPAADQVALGMVDQRVPGRQLIASLKEIPRLGHPFGPQELVPQETSLMDLIQALSDRKLVIDGEHSVELTPAGRSIRSVIHFKPRESILTKVLNRISVTFNLRDLFGRPPSS